MTKKRKANSGNPAKTVKETVAVVEDEAEVLETPPVKPAFGELAPDETIVNDDEAAKVTFGEIDGNTPVDDDELIVNNSKDSKLEETDSYGVYKQDEGVVSWTIVNFIDANEKVYSKRELQANPPILTFEDSDGTKAEFVLTKEFSGSLASVFEKVHYGYYGLDKRPKKKYAWKDLGGAFSSAIGRRPLQSAALGAVVLLGFISVIFQ